jgi:biopolymer transport protein ExbD
MQFVPERRGRGTVINVTSLIDVMFLLLIFFMVSSTFKLQPAIELTLPRSATAEAVAATPVVVYLARDGQLYVNEQPIDRESLRTTLARRLSSSNEDRLVLRADEGAEHGAVVALIDLVKEAGYRRVSLAAKPGGER